MASKIDGERQLLNAMRGISLLLLLLPQFILFKALQLEGRNSYIIIVDEAIFDVLQIHKHYIEIWRLSKFKAILWHLMGANLSYKGNPDIITHIIWWLVSCGAHATILFVYISNSNSTFLKRNIAEVVYFKWVYKTWLQHKIWDEAANTIGKMGKW